MTIASKRLNIIDLVVGPRH